MSPLRSPALAAVGATLLVAVAAPAGDPPAPAPPAPAAAPPAAPVRAVHAGARAPKDPLPEPQLRVWVVAPSAKGLWTLHLENEGPLGLRVPADIRLLRFTIESGDTMSKRQPKPIHCGLPASMRPDVVADRNALLLGPGDSYVESFDPRLFCFGSAAGAALQGGALVRVRYGWEPPARGVKKMGPPFVVEGTAFPAVVEPQKQVVGPSMVLSWLAPEEPDEEAAPAEDEPPAPEAGHEPEPIVDENAPRFELHAPSHVDAVTAFRVSLAITVTNAGHRPGVAAIRPRMLGFRVEGPDGLAHCPAAPPTRGLPREAFQTLKPGGSVAFTILVEEACGRDVFRRPGLYRLQPVLHLDERGDEHGLSAITGILHTAEPTLVRISEGPEPFYKSPPAAVRAPPPEPAP